jgi:hypothetical protein
VPCAPATATVQEVHQVAVHLLCAAVDLQVGADRRQRATLDPYPAPGERAPSSSSGDALLDRDLVGTVDRLCPDAPVPVVDSPVDDPRPGGAGLAALLAAADGRDVVLVTALAQDAPGRELADLLHRAGVRVVDLGLDGATPEKVRVRSDGRSLLRLDPAARPARPGDLTDEGADAIAGRGAVLVADYGRGVAALPGVRDAVAACARRARACPSCGTRTRAAPSRSPASRS